jgi:membrane dipeptidase
MLSENSDLILLARTSADIYAAKESGKVAIILGFQNTSALEDRLETLELYKQLGVGVIQLTYNTQNLIGSGVWEENDGGLSGFGREAIAEMNRLGIMVDLSHVASRTSDEAINCSRKPCVYSHVSPSGLLPHPRNKSDDQLRTIVAHNGFVGVTPHTPFMSRGTDATIDDCVELLEYIISVCGESKVGLGSDITQGRYEAFFEWVRRDKGYARKMFNRTGKTPPIKDFACFSHFPRMTDAMLRRGWTETRVRGVLGENWLAYLSKVLG